MNSVGVIIRSVVVVCSTIDSHCHIVAVGASEVIAG